MSAEALRSAINQRQEEIYDLQDDIDELSSEIKDLERTLETRASINPLDATLAKLLEVVTDKGTWKEAEMVRSAIAGEYVASEDIGRIKLLARTMLGVTL